MTAAEINRGLADALGWELGGPTFLWVWKLPGGTGVMDFRPAEDSNHLRLYVLPEIERRGLWADMSDAVLNNCPADVQKRAEEAAKLLPSCLDEAAPLVLMSSVVFLTAPPAVIAAAALKVLGGEG